MGWVGVVTDAGKELFASYAQSGLTLSVDSVKTGSGTMSQSSMHSATALVTQKDVGVVESKTAVTGGTQFRLRVGPASSTVGSYVMKEMGLFITGTYGGSSSTVMVAYFMETDDGVEIPLSASFPDFAFILSAVLVIDNTIPITLTVDSSAYVSYTQFTSGLAEKVDLDQGEANAGKFMIVGSDGIVAPVTVPFANEGVY